MNFKDLLWDQIDLIAAKSNERRNLFKKITNLLLDRAVIEDNYAKQLEELSIKFQRLVIDSDAITTLVSGIANSLNCRIKQTLDLAKGIRGHIVKELKETFNDQTQQAQKFIDDGRHLDNLQKQKQYDLDRLIHDYKKKELESEQVEMQSLILRACHEVSMEKKYRQSQKAEYAVKETMRNELQVQDSIYNYNRFLDYYKDNMDKIMTGLQSQDHQRIDQLQGAGYKLFIYELAQSKNISYDVERSNEIIQTVNAEVDIATFINKFTRKPEFFRKRVFSPVTSFMRTCLEGIRNNGFEDYDRVIKEGYFFDILKGKISLSDEQVQQPQEAQTQDLKPVQEIKHAQVGKLCEFLVRFLTRLWVGEYQESEYEQFYQSLKNNPLGRRCWVVAFSQFRVQNKFEMERQGFLATQRMLKILLDICLDEKDAYTARKLIVLAFTFYTIVSDEEIEMKQNQGDQPVQPTRSQRKIFLQVAIQNHAIWKNRDFWETVFFFSIYDELKQQQGSTRSDQFSEIVEREKNTIFGQLATIAHNMLMFDQQKSEVRDLVVRYSKHYLLTDEQLKSLLNTVDTFSQIKSTLVISQIQDESNAPQQQIKVLQQKIEPSPIQEEQKDSMRETFSHGLRYFMELALKK